MQHAQQVLGYSVVVALAIDAIVVSKVGASAYASTLGGQDFKYRFDKSKLPKSLGIICAIAVASFGYAVVISKQAEVALLFSLMITFFGAIATVISVAYVRRNEKR